MDKCKLPPEGWLCSRNAEHEGPCAAYQDAGIIAHEWQTEGGALVCVACGKAKALAAAGCYAEDRKAHAFYAGFDSPALKIDPIGPTAELRKRIAKLETALHVIATTTEATSVEGIRAFARSKLVE